MLLDIGEDNEFVQSDDEDVVNLERVDTQPLSARYNLSPNDVH